jgi:hypothetical protein
MALIKTITGKNTHVDGILVGVTGEKIGFLGATPVVKPSGAGQAIPTDLASCIVFNTKIRADLISLGLIKGSA